MNEYTEHLEIVSPLTDDDIVEIGRQMAENTIEIDRLNVDAKVYSARCKEKAKKIAGDNLELSHRLKSGVITQVIPMKVVIANGKKSYYYPDGVFYRDEPYEEVVNESPDIPEDTDMSSVDFVADVFNLKD